MGNSTDRLNGVLSTLAIKAPCVVATVANITLSGEQTVNGVAVVANDRVLVKDQTAGLENGVYDVATSAWQRSADWDGNRDIIDGTLVVVASPNAIYQLNGTNPITIGTSSISFTVLTLVGSGTFTINWIGFSGSVTSTAIYRHVGNMVMLTLSASLISGTSDATTKVSTTGDIPAAIRPSVSQIIGSVKTTDNGGVFQYGEVQISGAGIISVRRDAINTLWTASGSASINPFNGVYYI